MNIIKENITFRAIEFSDSEFLKEMINDPELESMVLGWSLPVSTARQNNWIENLKHTEMKFIVNVENERYGLISITNLDYKNSTANLNIKLRNFPNRIKGIGTKSVGMLCDFCFNELNLNCLTASILEYNVASQKTFEKCGFVKEGTLRSRIYKKGQYHDVYIYSILKDDFLDE